MGGQVEQYQTREEKKVRNQESAQLVGWKLEGHINEDIDAQMWE